jgi:hypothetical protein
MPATDYTDPEIPFPRLQARIQKVENDAYWITIWLWEKPGNERRLLTNGKRAGSFPDAHEIVAECARQYGADVGPDDITVEM